MVEINKILEPVLEPIAQRDFAKLRVLLFHPKTALRAFVLSHLARQADLECLLNIDPQDFEFRNFFEQSARYGHLKCLRHIAALGNPEYLSYRALLLASGSGHVECVRFLIPLCDPLYGNSLALGLAAQDGHVECAELLLALSEPLAQHSYPLQVASRKGCRAGMELLYDVSDPVAALQCAQKDYSHQPAYWTSLEQMIIEKVAQKQNAVLNSALSESQFTRPMVCVRKI